MLSVEELEQLIQTAFSQNISNSFNNNNNKQKTLELLNSFRQQDQEALAKYSQLLITTTDSQVFFYILGIFQTSIPKTSVQNRYFIRSTLLSYWHDLSNNSTIASNVILGQTFIRTKFGIVIAQCIKYEYPQQWNNAFDTLIQLSSLECSSAATTLNQDLFLRVLSGVAQEIGENEVDYQHSSAEFEQNVRIKDIMRGLTLIENCDGNDLKKVIQVLLSIYSHSIPYHLSASASGKASLNSKNEIEYHLPSFALNILKSYLEWCDFDLLSPSSQGAASKNKEMQILPLLFESLRLNCCDEAEEYDSVPVRAAYCLKEIISRGMEDKIKITFLNEWNIMQNILLLPDQNFLFHTQETTIYLVIALSDIVNVLGIELLGIWDSSSSSSSPCQTTLVMEQLMKQYMMLFFQCFSYDDIDVTTTILPVLTRFTLALKKEVKKNQQQHQNTLFLSSFVPQIFAILYERLLYPTDYIYTFDDGEDLDDDCTIVQEKILRAELYKIYIKFIQVEPQYVLKVFICQNVLPKLCSPISSTPFPILEVALQLVFHYSQGLLATRDKKKKRENDITKNQDFKNILVSFHTSDILHHSNQQIILLYYELTIRYHFIFLSQQNDLHSSLSNILNALTGEKGLQYPDSIFVRARCCYFIFKLFKCVLMVVPLNFVEVAVQGIFNYLKLSSENQQQLAIVNDDDLLYLFETVSVLLAHSVDHGMDIGKITGFLGNVLQVQLHLIELLYHENTIATSSAVALPTPESIKKLSFYITTIAYLTKGFTNSNKTPIEIQHLFYSMTMKPIQTILQTFPTNASIRSKCMILLQRFVKICHESNREMFLASLLQPSILILISNQCHEEFEDDDEDNMIDGNVNSSGTILITKATDFMDISQLLIQTSFLFQAKTFILLDVLLLPYLQLSQAITTTTTVQSDETTTKNSNKSSNNNNAAFYLQSHSQSENTTIQKYTILTLYHIVHHKCSEIYSSSNNTERLPDILNYLNDSLLLFLQKDNAIVDVDDAYSISKTCLAFFQEFVTENLHLKKDVVDNFVKERMIPKLLEALVQVYPTKVDNVKMDRFIQKVAQFFNSLFLISKSYRTGLWVDAKLMESFFTDISSIDKVEMGLKKLLLCYSANQI